MGEIYIITNKINGKQYVGQTIKTHDLRFRQHIRKRKSYIGNAINKYGEDNFKVELILRCDNKMLDEYEIKFISAYNTIKPNGYNLTEGGSVNILTEESREKIRQSKLGKKHTDDAKRKIGEANSGRKHTEEHKKKIGNAFKGTVLTEEHKEKISKANTGKKRTDEMKKRISEAGKGRKHTEETKERLKQVNTGRKMPIEAVEKQDKLISVLNEQKKLKKK